MNNYFRLTIHLTILSPDGSDVRMSTSRTLPFQPVEGLVLMLPQQSDPMDDGYDAEYPITLGAPTYSYLESSFVEYQEDEDVIALMRDGRTSLRDAMNDMVKFYEIYGFRKEV